MHSVIFLEIYLVEHKVQVVVILRGSGLKYNMEISLEDCFRGVEKK